MLVVTLILILCSHAAPAPAIVGPSAVGNRAPYGKALLPAGKGDVTKKMSRRTQMGAGPYTGLTIQGPSGSIGMGDGGGYGPGAYVNQGSSGTVATSNAGTSTVVPVQLTFTGVPFGYQFSASIQQSIINYASQLMMIQLQPAFQLMDVSFAAMSPQNGGRNNNWQGGVQNQNGQIAGNNQNRNGLNGSGAGIDWASNGSGNGGQNGVQNNWQNGGQNGWQNSNWQGGVQNQNGQTAWNNQNSNGANGAGGDIYWAVNGSGNGGQNGVQNNWQNGGQNGVQNQNGQTAWNNQNSNGLNGSGAGIDWASNGSGSGGQNGGQNNWQNGGQNGWQNSNWQGGVQNQNGQTAWNNQNGAGNNWQNGGQNGVQNQNGQTAWNNQGDIYWAVNGGGNNNNVNGVQNNWQNGGQNGGQNYNWQGGVQNQNGQTAWNNQNSNGANGAGGDIYWAVNGNGNGGQNGVQSNWQNGGQNNNFLQGGAQNQNGQTAWNNQNSNGINGSGAGSNWASNGSGNNNWNNNGWQNLNGVQGSGQTTISWPIRVTVNSSPDLSSSALTYVMQALLNNIQVITNYVRVLDGYAFNSLMISVETSNFANPVGSPNVPPSNMQIPVPPPIPMPSYISTPWPSLEYAFFPSDESTPMPSVGFDFSPSDESTPMPTVGFDFSPSDESTPMPTVGFDFSPSDESTPRPSLEPTFFPTNIPTTRASLEPTQSPSLSPTEFPTELPTEATPENAETSPLTFNLGQISPNSVSSIKNRESIPRGYIEDGDEFNDAGIFTDMFNPASINTEPDVSIEPFDPASVTTEAETEMVEMEKTEHPVQLIFENVYVGFSLSAAYRASIIQYIKELMDDYLIGTLKLVQVDYFGSTGEKSLSLLIVVKGSADMSHSAFAYVMKVLQDHDQDLEMFIKSLDWIAFKNVGVSIGTYDPDSITIIPESEMVKSEHPIQLTFNNSPPGYHLMNADQESIIQFVEELINDNLKEPFELIEVTYIGGDHHRSLLSSIFYRVRRLYDLSLPLLVAVKGPEDQSDSALAHVMEVLEDHEQDIQTFAKTLDWSSFKDVSVFVSSYESNLMTTEAGIELVEMETTEHPFQFTVNNVPSGYQLTPADRASFIRYIEEIIDDRLDNPLELIEVKYAGGDGERSLLSFMVHHTRRLDALSLPLRITVKGPVDQSDFILSYIMEVLKEHEQDILRKLWSLDWDAFKNVGLSIPEIREMETTVHPVQLALENVPAEYHFSATNRSSILLFVKELLEDNIDDQFQLIEVTYPGCENHSNIIGKTRGYAPIAVRNPNSLASLHKNDNGRRLFSSRRYDASLPLQITVRGPHDLNDRALYVVTSVLENNMQDLVNKLKSLDWDALLNVKFSVSYDLDSVSEPCLETVDMRETEHPVKLTFNDVVPGYSLSADNRASIISFVTTLLEENLDDSLKLVNVVANTTRTYNRSLFSYVRRLEALYLPLLVTVRGPADESDFALSNIRAIIDDHERNIELYLESLDNEAFTTSSVSVDEISDPAMPANKMIMIMDDMKEDAYWWVWLLATIGFLFLFCCICICVGCLRTYKQIKSKSRKRDCDVPEKQTFDDNSVLIETPAFNSPMQHHSTSSDSYSGMDQNTSIVSIPFADHQDESQYGNSSSLFSPPNTSSASSLSSHTTFHNGDVIDGVSTFAGRSLVTFGGYPPEESTVLSMTSDAFGATASQPQPRLLQIHEDPNIYDLEAQSYPTQCQTHAADEPSDTNYWDEEGLYYTTEPGPPRFVAPGSIESDSRQQRGGVGSDESELYVVHTHTFC